MYELRPGDDEVEYYNNSLNLRKFRGILCPRILRGSESRPPHLRKKNWAHIPILCPDISGKARKATDTELQYMMLHAIPRAKITSLDTKIEGTVACFIV